MSIYVDRCFKLVCALANLTGEKVKIIVSKSEVAPTEMAKIAKIVISLKTGPEKLPEKWL